MCTPIPQAQEEHGDITEFILITHEHSYMSRVFMSFFPFMCAFVKKGAAITERQRQKYSKRKDDQYMLSSYFKANKHHMLPSAVQRAPQKSHIKVEERRASQVGCFFYFYHHFPALIYHSGQIHHGNLPPEFLCCSGPLSPPLSCLPLQITVLTGGGTAAVPGRNWE